MGGTWCGWDLGWGSHNKKAPFYCESTTPGPTHTGSHPHVVSTHRNIMASPLPFSFASVRARTQNHRDILKWGALSLPTELAQLVVRVLPISICPCGIGFELSRRRNKSSVGSESAPHFNMSLWSWVRALTEAKENGRGLAMIFP